LKTNDLLASFRKIPFANLLRCATRTAQLALVGGFRSEASLLGFPPFRLHLAQRLDCAVEITLQFRLIAGHGLKGTPHDSFYLEVINVLVVVVARNFGRLDYLALHDRRTTQGVGVMLVLASKSPNDHPLTVPSAIKREIISPNRQFKTFVKNAVVKDAVHTI
jgi:hypothetical protein